jgi:SRSO17 transposase
LLLELPRKSMEPMVLALEGTSPKAVRAMQQCLTEGAWDDEAILTRHWQEVEPALGDDEGVLTLDGRDVPQQGTHSVGVTRQDGGELGKRANCQAGVCLGDASPQGYTWLDRRWFLPQEWLTDAASADRRRACGVPAETVVTTQPRLGWAMIPAVSQAGTLRGRWVACDEALGRDTTLLDHGAGLGLWYDAEVPHDTRVGPARPATAVPPWSGRGRQPTRAQVVAGAAEAQAVADSAPALPTSGWSQQSIKEGSKGPIVAECAVARVVAVREGLPGPEVWGILRRKVCTGERKTSLSHAPA